MKTVYIASKTRHAARWRHLREEGIRVIATWIDLPVVSDAAETFYQNLWLACIGESSSADATIVFAEEGDVLKGALIELGSALAAGKTVIQVGECASLKAGDGSDASFTCHPNWTFAPTTDDALRFLGYVR